MRRLKIAYLHYHLRPGGVSTVIGHQVRAVAENCDTLIVTSTVPPDARKYGTPINIAPLVAYDSDVGRSFTPIELADSILSAITQKWPGGCDVLHVHNATLAKNKHLLDALDILRVRGVQLFIQIHDFAEDGRPDVYSPRAYTDDVHYGVINSRDYHILNRAGLKSEGLHIISNQVSPLIGVPLKTPPEIPKDRGLVLYPVRGIRRKNIGEALLLSLFLPNNYSLGITLPPTSQQDIFHFCQWKKFVQQYYFNVRFGVGENADFIQLVKNAPFFGDYQCQ